MDTAYTGDLFSGDGSFLPSLPDDADLLQFLTEMLDENCAAHCSIAASSLEDIIRDTGERPRMCGSRSLPDLHRPVAACTARPAELSTVRTTSSNFTAVRRTNEHRSISRVQSDISHNQPSKPLAPPSDVSSSLITETWRGDELKEQAVEPYLQHWDAAWDHDHSGNCQSLQEWGNPSKDRVVLNAPATVNPMISEPLATEPGELQFNLLRPCLSSIACRGWLPNNQARVPQLSALS